MTRKVIGSVGECTGSDPLGGWICSQLLSVVLAVTGLLGRSRVDKDCDSCDHQMCAGGVNFHKFRNDDTNVSKTASQYFMNKQSSLVELHYIKASKAANTRLRLNESGTTLRLRKSKAFLELLLKAYGAFINLKIRNSAFLFKICA